MQAYLKKHGKDFANHRLQVKWKRDGLAVEIDFEIQKRTRSPWSVDEAFTEDWSKNWGLWNKDVFEAFLQLRQHADDLKAPYLEVQVSPLNQPFALIITEPRKTFFAPSRVDLQTSVEKDDKIWKGVIRVTLPDDLVGKELYGGFFACLEQDPREFYALGPNPEERPDFHRPELFLPLDH